MSALSRIRRLARVVLREQRCKREVFHGYGTGSHQCKLKAWPNGFCARHQPKVDKAP
jgi:hypothetical protein